MAYPGYPNYYPTDPYRPDPYAVKPSARDYMGPPPLPEPRMQDPRMQDPRMQDPRMPAGHRYREDPVVSQPPRMGMEPFPQLQGREWRSDLFDCTQDPKTCFCVLCNPCYPFYLVEKFGESWLNVLCMGSAVTFLALRYKVRAKENIQGSLIGDCCVTTFCGTCMVCQLKRERDQILRTEGRQI